MSDLISRLSEDLIVRLPTSAITDGTTANVRRMFVERAEAVIALQAIAASSTALVGAASALAKRTLEYVGENPDPEYGHVLDADAEMRKCAQDVLEALKKVFEP